MDECTVAVGKAMSKSQLENLEAAQQAAAAHVAAEDDEELEHRRRLKPHLFGARPKAAKPNLPTSTRSRSHAPSPRIASSRPSSIASRRPTRRAVTRARGRRAAS